MGKTTNALEKVIAIYFSHLLNGKTSHLIQKSIPALVILIGTLFRIRGLGLGIPYLSPAAAIEIAPSSVECH